MWKRLRRRTLAPSRPVVYPQQLGLLLLSLLVIVAGIWAILKVLL
jgi:hypothetical protein